MKSCPHGIVAGQCNDCLAATLKTESAVLSDMRQTARAQTIRVGQRLINWDGQRGYVALNSAGKRVFGSGEQFKIEWLDADGAVEDAQYLTLENFEREGIKRGRGIMPWAL